MGKEDKGQPKHWVNRQDLTRQMQSAIGDIDEQRRILQEARRNGMNKKIVAEIRQQFGVSVKRKGMESEGAEASMELGIDTPKTASKRFTISRGHIGRLARALRERGIDVPVEKSGPETSEASRLAREAITNRQMTPRQAHEAFGVSMSTAKRHAAKAKREDPTFKALRETPHRPKKPKS